MATFKTRYTRSRLRMRSLSIGRASVTHCPRLSMNSSMHWVGGRGRRGTCGDLTGPVRPSARGAALQMVEPAVAGVVDSLSGWFRGIEPAFQSINEPVIAKIDGTHWQSLGGLRLSIRLR